MILDTMKRSMCDRVGATIRYIGSLMHPFNAHCTFDEEMVGPTRFLFWASVCAIYFFIAPPIIIRIKKSFDLRTRSRLFINRVSYRAMKGMHTQMNMHK